MPPRCASSPQPHRRRRRSHGPTAAAARSACPLSILHALNATACAPSAQPPARSRYTLLRSASPPPPHRRRLRSPSLPLCCRALSVPSDQSECALCDRKRPKYTLGASVALHAAAERWPFAAPHHACRPTPSRRCSQMAILGIPPSERLHRSRVCPLYTAVHSVLLESVALPRSQLGALKTKKVKVPCGLLPF